MQMHRWPQNLDHNSMFSTQYLWTKHETFCEWYFAVFFFEKKIHFWHLFEETEKEILVKEKWKMKMENSEKELQSSIHNSIKYNESIHICIKYIKLVYFCGRSSEIDKQI